MTSIRAIWAELDDVEQRGGSRRVYDRRGHDFYAALNSDGFPGLQLLSADEPPPAPDFDVVDIVIVRRQDGKWLISIWLRDKSLTDIFSDLCQSLIHSARDVPPISLPGFVFLRLLSWQRLLEAAKGNTLSGNSLRGLVGEMLILERCLELLPSWRSRGRVDGPSQGAARLCTAEHSPRSKDHSSRRADR